VTRGAVYSGVWPLSYLSINVVFVFTGLFIRLYAWDLSKFRRNSVRLFRKNFNSDDFDPMRGSGSLHSYIKYLNE